MVKRELSDPHSRIAGRDAGEILEELEPRRGPERMLDLMLRTGPHGDAFGDEAGGLTLEVLEENPHGVDLGPLQPRHPRGAAHGIGQGGAGAASRWSPTCRACASRSRGSATGTWCSSGAGSCAPTTPGCTTWIRWCGARTPVPPSCTPTTPHGWASPTAIAALLRSRAGQIDAPVEVTDAVMPGVVSLPHGWGHDAAGARISVAAAHPGVNSNVLADESVVEAVSGNAVLSGIPVEIEPAG